MDAQWELHKEEIVSLYRQRTAQEVRDHMWQAHSFNATPQQYERRLKKWGVRKNLKAEEWRVIIRRIAKRKAEDDKESELRVDDYPFPPRKVLRAISRYQEGTIDRFQREQRPFRSPTPEGCQLLTPVISALPSPGLVPVFSLNLDRTPLLQFQRFMGQKFVVFQELLSHLASDKTDYAVVTRPTTELSQSVQHNTLVLQAVHESSFTLSPSTITQKALRKFFEAVFHTTNHILDDNESRNKTFQKLVMEVLERMIQTHQNKAFLIHAISEQNPTLDALIEISFQTALLENRVDLVRFLIEAAKFNPNDMISMSSGYFSPIEVALLQENHTMAELLIDLGADLRESFSEDYKGSLNSLVNARPEFLQKILVKWYANTFDAPAIFWKHVGCREFLRKVSEKAVNLQQTQTASMRNTSEDTKFALSALKAAVFNDDLQTAGTIIASCKHQELEVMDETEDGLVFSAVEVGSIDMVRLLLRSGADVNVPGLLSVSPLTMAILDEKLHMAKFLIDWGASIESCSSHRYTAPTPLQAAASKGYYEIASTLISRGADVKAAPSTISSYSKNERLSRITRHTRDMYGKSALEIAVFNGRTNCLELAQLLVESGADADACLDGAIHGTIYRKVRYPPITHEVFTYLLTVCSSFSVGDALYIAIELGYMQSLRFLSGREGNGTALASSLNPNVSSAINCTDSELQVEMVSQLIQHGIELKLSDNRKWRFTEDLYATNPALAELLVQNGVYVSIFTDLEDALLGDDEDRVERSSEKLFSISPDPRLLRHPCFGHSVLITALRWDEYRFDTVPGLPRWGVRVDLPCIVPIVILTCSRGTVEDLRILLSFGAPVNLERDFECECWDTYVATEIFTLSPLQVAARHGRADMVEALLRAGALVDFVGEVHEEGLASFTVSSVYHRTDLPCIHESTLNISVEGGLEIVKMILNAGADVNEPADENGGRTVLQKAAQVGDIEIVEYLVRERHADVNAAPAEWAGVTALQAAAINSHFDVVHMLLEMGADSNAPGAEELGRTALEGAAERGRIDMVQLLLDNGADVSSPDFGAIQLQNAVKLARRQGFHAVARMLERHRDGLALTL